MKIEFLDDISNGGQYKDVVSEQLMRLSDFDSKEAASLQQQIKQLLEKRQEINLATLDFIHPVNCSLTLKVADENLGIRRISDGHFECILTKGSYEEMILLIQPFVDNELNGYQWLYDINTEIDFLLSPGGTW